MTAWLYRAIVQAILGPVHRLTGWPMLPPSLHAYFTDAPRKRPKQTTTARHLFMNLGVPML